MINAMIVRRFIERVRSGLAPDEAALYLAPQVAAHQVTSERLPQTLQRTLADYAAHIRDFRACFGDFRLELEELMAQGDKVYARWRQHGHHLGELYGYAPTGLPLVTVDSAVYQLQGGKIVAYWMQQESSGLLAQLQAHAHSGGAAA